MHLYLLTSIMHTFLYACTELNSTCTLVHICDIVRFVVATLQYSRLWVSIVLVHAAHSSVKYITSQTLLMSAVQRRD